MFVRASLALLLLTAGCAASLEPTESAESSATAIAFAPPVLEAPRGGSDPARWRPEAALANAATSALAAAWKRDGVSDAIASVPVRMWSSDLHPYGDGQSNAVPSFEGWNGRSLINRENITSSTTPFAALSSHTFTASYNGTANGHPQPFTPSDTHGRFPYFNRLLVTAVGTSSFSTSNGESGSCLHNARLGSMRGRGTRSRAAHALRYERSTSRGRSYAPPRSIVGCSL